MSDQSQPDNGNQVDAYMDGVLSPDEKRVFEARLERESQLRAEVELSRQVDASLRRTFSSPAVDERWLRGLLAQQQAELVPAAEPQLSAMASESATTGGSRRWLVAAAAVLICAVAWSWVILRQFHQPEREPLYAGVPMSELYQQKVATGFQPKWVCEDDQEFADTFQKRQGLPLRLAPMPAGTQMAGLDYLPALTLHTTAMLATVDGRPVIVFVERAERVVKPPQEPPADSGLHLFRRRLADLVLYEVTPRDAPSVMEYLEVVDSR